MRASGSGGSARMAMTTCTPALSRIGRNLVTSDPYLDGLFQPFAMRTERRWTPRVERIAPWPRRVLARLRRGARKPSPDSSLHHL
jgi:hypothetical protein